MAMDNVVHAANRIDRKDWLRFKFMAYAVRRISGRSTTDISKEISSTQGWLTSALKYRWQVSDIYFRKMQNLAIDLGIPTDPPLMENGQIPETIEEVDQILHSLNLLTDMKTDTRGPRTVITSKEHDIAERAVAELKRRGVTMGSISTDWLGYGHFTSIHQPMNQRKITVGKFTHLRETIKSRLGADVWDALANGTEKIPTRVIKPESKPVKTEKVAPVEVKTEEPDSFIRIATDLQAIINRIEALSNQLPKTAKDAINSDITHSLELAVMGLNE